jgi:hypothetical protein
MRFAKSTPVSLSFKDSPFYTILKPLTPLIECPSTAHLLLLLQSFLLTDYASYDQPPALSYDTLTVPPRRHRKASL